MSLLRLLGCIESVHLSKGVSGVIAKQLATNGQLLNTVYCLSESKGEVLAIPHMFKPKYREIQMNSDAKPKTRLD